MIRILIADDHAIVRAGLRQFISDQPDMVVAGEAATGTEAIALVRAGQFDVVLLDISMPDKNGIDTLKTLKQLRPDLPVLMLSGYAEDQYAVNLLRAGAAGYLNKEAAATQLVGAVRTVVRGRKFVSPALAQILADGVTGNADRPLHGELSQREFQIFCKLAAGVGGLEDRRRAAPVRQDGQHLPHARAREDGDEVQRRPDLLRDQERADRLMVTATGAQIVAARAVGRGFGQVVALRYAAGETAARGPRPPPLSENCRSNGAARCAAAMAGGTERRAAMNRVRRTPTATKRRACYRLLRHATEPTAARLDRIAHGCAAHRMLAGRNLG